MKEPRLDQLSQDELREVQVGILRELDRLCRSAGLTYFLAYGTLLGALRHGGHIPWDDDVDVMMPRPDYDRFLEVFDDVVAVPHLSVAHRRSRPGWPLPYAKVVDDRTDLVEPFEVPVSLGVNVDVFPLDVVPASAFVRGVQRRLLRRLLWALELKYIAAWRGRGWHRPAALRWGKWALRPVSLEVLVGVVEALARIGRRGSDRSVLVGSTQWQVSRRAVEPASTAVFDGVTCSVPACPDVVLTAMYGDWQRVPGEADQVAHHSFTVRWRDRDEDRGR